MNTRILFSHAPVTVLLALILFLSACANTAPVPAAAPLPSENGTGQRDTGLQEGTKGDLIGANGEAAAGALPGWPVGGKNGTAIGAIIEAAAGGATGAVIGRKMDQQAAELQRDMANARVERVGEGIKITLDAGILFNTNKAVIRAEALTDLDKLVAVLQKHPDTNVLVEGHTDNAGSDALNQPLSERRAQSVANVITARGVAAGRIRADGYGSSQPVADNTTEAGRQANRRVEIAIYANEKMKKAADTSVL
ncbi:OmpA family protein [Hymenobacter terrenus]|uniref:OmpA family protein n=1 Tax=Hymenobacter terrenus TaxID=1629124 RepID=UPI000B1BDB64|nr:OmpA family protein [Hymenobacter terrenus]